MTKIWLKVLFQIPNLYPIFLKMK